MPVAVCPRLALERAGQAHQAGKGGGMTGPLTSSLAWFIDSSKRRASTSLRYRSAAIQRDRHATSCVVCRHG